MLIILFISLLYCTTIIQSIHILQTEYMPMKCSPPSYFSSTVDDAKVIASSKFSYRDTIVYNFFLAHTLKMTSVHAHTFISSSSRHSEYRTLIFLLFLIAFVFPHEG